ncbi:MAG: hypothetical protein GF418_15110 [Chitinivibrionales bacterium]|nr:hypothetical protein [Chitinivibrionales bacterium]MBD3396950.1 hypothetical protein [Chitinivibrionales bacterium]
MDHVFRIALIMTVLAGIVSEVVTIAAPGRILGITDADPGELMQSRFYRVVFVLSGLYLLAIVLMLVSGSETFRRYAFLLIGLSLLAWIFRRLLLRIRALQVAESTACLVLLFDTLRTLTATYLS